MAKSKEKRTPNWMPLLALIVGTLIGPGFIWQWWQYGREGKKQELEEIIKTTDLRRQENDLYAKIIDLSNEYINADHEFAKTPSDELRTRMAQQDLELGMMKDNFMALEAKLSHLESRMPRTIPLEFRTPKAPTGVTVTNVIP